MQKIIVSLPGKMLFKTEISLLQMRKPVSRRLLIVSSRYGGSKLMFTPMLKAFKQNPPRSMWR